MNLELVIVLRLYDGHDLRRSYDRQVSAAQQRADRLALRLREVGVDPSFSQSPWFVKTR